MIPLGILASSVRRASAALLAPTNLVATLVEPAPPLPTVIGEPYGGGFYAGEIQYPNGQWYKLIVADVSVDITGDDSRWKTERSTTDGTDSLTDGVANTTSMIAAGAALHPAANHCVNHTGGGNSDWYMPAKDELNVIYQNLGYDRPNCPPDFQSGGPQALADAYYWASTQNSYRYGWSQHFSSGALSNYFKTTSNRRVRPVRRIPFTPEVPDLPTIIGEEFGGGYYIGDITIADGGADDGTYAVIMGGPESQATLAWKDPRSLTPGTDSNTNSMANTLAMQENGPTIHYAGMHCLGYDGGGFDDWCMPARHVLNLAWNNQASLGALAMEGQYYLSSTQHSDDFAWAQEFSNGSETYHYKDNSYRVRPVRQLKRP